jgi:hypothetical protein
MTDTIKPAALRMRVSRQRRQEGYRVMRLEVHDREIEGLVRCGLLAEDCRTDREAIARAFGALLDRMSPERWKTIVGKYQ